MAELSLKERKEQKRLAREQAKLAAAALEPTNEASSQEKSKQQGPGVKPKDAIDQSQSQLGNEFVMEVPLGDKILKFTPESIPAEQVESLTYVDELTNGRKQRFLSPTTLKPLMASMVRRKQLYPVYCFKHSDGRREVIDGSCRRFVSIETEQPLLALTCDLSNLAFEISKDDKVQLREDLSTSTGRSLYDIGAEADNLMKTGECNTQADVAEYLGISTRKVSEGLEAYKVPVDIIALFDDYNCLTRNDYKNLNKLVNQTAALGTEVDTLVDELGEAISNFGNLDDEIEQAEKIVQHINSLIKDEKEKKKKVTGDYSKKHNYLEGIKSSSRIYSKSTMKNKNLTVNITLVKPKAEMMKEVHEFMKGLANKYKQKQ